MSLRNLLQKNRNARKIFGKKEIGIILKQLEGITLSQSEKNRLSRDVRPKLRLIKEISGFEEQFDLKKNSDNQRIINDVVDKILQERQDVEAILLFGSHVKGIVTKRSDIDICIVFNNIQATEATKFRAMISGDFPEKVDIQVFNVLPQKLKREIARNHKVLYKGKGFDNMAFTIRYLKDEDYFIRAEKIIGEAA